MLATAQTIPIAMVLKKDAIDNKGMYGSKYVSGMIPNNKDTLYDSTADKRHGIKAE